MAQALVSDALWSCIEPLIPVVPPSPHGGRPRVPDRAALTGILFVLKTGIPWEDLPQEMGCGSGMTCWRRLRDWQKAGVWSRLLPYFRQMRHFDQIDWRRALVDFTHPAAQPARRKHRSQTARIEPRRQVAAIN